MGFVLPMRGPKISRKIIQFFVLGFTAITLAGILFLFPAVSPVRAANGIDDVTILQARSAITIYLPVIYRSPTPAEELVDLINAERIRQGRSPLEIDGLIMDVAEAHSQDMINRNFFDHTNPDGLTPGDRLSNAGYTWSWSGENIGAGYTTPQAMFNAWMNSSGHRNNILSANYTKIGIGYVTGGYYGHYWTADFARPAP